MTSAQPSPEWMTRAACLDWNPELLQRDPLDLRHVDERFKGRFWSKVAVAGPDECWPWLASTKGGPHGYGQFYIRKGVPVTASRVALALQGYVLTHELVACHRCDNPPCVNPAHLFVGTYSDNAEDSVAKGRARRSYGEAHRDAKLTEATVIALRAGAPYRYGDYARLGRLLGCSRNTIRRAVIGARWRHVPIDPSGSAS